MAQLTLYRDFAAATGDLQLTQKQYAVLELVASNLAVSQTAIAETLDMDRATLMALVDRLQNRGFVERRTAAEDRRRQEIHLTPPGQAFVEQARRRIAEHERTMFSGWSTEELGTLRRLLQRLHAGPPSQPEG